MILYLKSSFSVRWKLYVTLVLVIACLGIGYLSTQVVTERISIEAHKDLEDHWRYQYDILVTPELDQEVRGLADGWVTPQSSIASYGGISLEDWEAIKEIDGVEVAAPVSMLGFFEFVGMNSHSSNAQPGNWYEIHKQVTAFDGLKSHTLSEYSFISEYYSPDMEETYLYQRRLKERGYPINVTPGSSVRYPNEMLLVAIDPEMEEKLFNVSDSMVSGSYLDDFTAEVASMPVVSVIALQQPSYEMEERITVHEISVPEDVSSDDVLGRTDDYLNSLPKEQIAELTISTMDRDLRYEYADIHFDDDGYVKVPHNLKVVPTEIIKFSPITYDLIEHNEGELPILQAAIYRNTSEFYDNIHVPFYRYEMGQRRIYDFTVDIIGYYDSSKITPNYEGAWEQGDPVDIYTPHHSMIVKNGLGEEIKPTPLLPIPVKASYYPGAPDMLTTLENVRHVYGDDPPLSSIRVVVSDVDERSEESQRKIEAVATEIQEKTGHHVEIMLGSSASRVHVQLAGTEVDEAGTVEEGWQQRGVSWSIGNQIEQTNILLFVYLLVISIIFCFTVITHSLLNRSVDFAMLRAIGWPRTKLMMSLLLEVVIISFIPFIVLWIGDLWMNTLQFIDYMVIWLITFFILVISYGTGGFKALKLSPSKGLAGEGTDGAFLRVIPIRGILSYVVHQLFRRPLRFGLLTIVIALTTFMLLLTLATQQSLSDFLYLSFLGEAIDLKLSNYQTALLFVSILLALINTFLLLYLNFSERKKEFYIFRSIGWSTKQIQGLIHLESIIVSVAGSLLGALGGYYVIHSFLVIPIPFWIVGSIIVLPVLLISLYTFCFTAKLSMNTVRKNRNAIFNRGT
ncbi:ABC transporter permease [Evansella tamaricis]|uniref:ABC transporter permease n=1 Tax=Evansella tamaricis TaxID=2069301 RepID=A0ABS6JK97_9BACI|nr:ABC transporter permease [Evansella tamaricis]MBU9714106.1 ABC transporter permease [Evansella tamaricis]